MRKGARLTAKEFKKALESHLPTEENIKLTYIEGFASLILHSVEMADKTSLLPVIAYVTPYAFDHYQ